MNSKKKQQSKNQPQIQGSQSVAQVFSMARDIGATNPYHIDGDVDMYSEQNIKIRQQLRNDPDIISSLSQLVDLYPKNQQGHIKQQTYKNYQSKLALILRPQIQKDQLKFIVDKDWELDSKEFQCKYLPKQKLLDSLFQLVDIWTIGNTKQQYTSFCRLLKKKLQRAIKIQT